MSERTRIVETTTRILVCDCCGDEIVQAMSGPAGRLTLTAGRTTSGILGIRGYDICRRCEPIIAERLDTIFGEAKG